MPMQSVYRPSSRGKLAKFPNLTDSTIPHGCKVGDEMKILEANDAKYRVQLEGCSIPCWIPKDCVSVDLEEIS